MLLSALSIFIVSNVMKLSSVDANSAYYQFTTEKQMARASLRPTVAPVSINYQNQPQPTVAPEHYKRMRNYECRNSGGGVVSVIDLDPDGKGSLPFPEEKQSDYVLFQYGYSQGRVGSSHEIDMTNDLIVVVHGLEEKAETLYQSFIQDLHRIKPRVDVVFVDWTAAAGVGTDSYGRPSNVSFEQAVSNTRIVGGCLARWLEANVDFQASKAYCIGIGLGAHACGFAGKTFTRQKWGRITALDPMERECNLGEYSRVSRNDTDFLDVIHTSCLTYSFGIGHVDYFVNDIKSNQPGCPPRPQCNAENGVMAKQSASSCSHLRSLLLLQSSFDQKCCLHFCSWHSRIYCRQAGFWSMGHSLDDKNGNFYGNITSLSLPYCSITTKEPCFTYNTIQFNQMLDDVRVVKTTRPTKWYQNQNKQGGRQGYNTNGNVSVELSQILAIFIFAFLFISPITHI